MDRIFSPWRSSYVRHTESGGGCIFCDKPAAGNDQEQFIVLRAERNFVLLNLYPYTSGHVMIAPYDHVASLEEADPAALAEMMQLARRVESALRAIYKPSGINLGMNIGQAAGAGVAGHIHLHMLPRWFGDVNFMTTVAETRVIPEDLEETYRNLRGQLAE